MSDEIMAGGRWRSSGTETSADFLLNCADATSWLDEASGRGGGLARCTMARSANWSANEKGEADVPQYCFTSNEKKDRKVSPLIKSDHLLSLYI